MFTKFWEKLAEGIAGQWTAQALAPALVFWGGGLVAWASRFGWDRLTEWVESIDSTPIYIALSVGGLVLLAASTALVEWLQLTALRLAEGYWPGPLRRFRFALAGRVENKLREQEQRWQALAAVNPLQRNAAQQAEFSELDAKLAHYPVDPRHLMPTRLGNVLRAAEKYPWVRYGLATSVCWPRLWLVLPKETQETLGQARARLNSAARFLVWSVLFVLWTVLAWWAALAGIVAAVAAYRAMLGAAGTYGDLLRGAFDLHRFALYEGLRWPPPIGPHAEEIHGQRLTEYLFRGTGAQGIPFTPPPEE